MKPTTIIRQLRKLADIITSIEYGDEEFVANDELLDLAQHITEALDEIEGVMEEYDNTGVRAISPSEFLRMSDEQLEKVIPPEYRGAFPGKENCSHDGRFYLWGGGEYDFTTGVADGWRD